MSYGTFLIYEMIFIVVGLYGAGLECYIVGHVGGLATGCFSRGSVWNCRFARGSMATSLHFFFTSTWTTWSAFTWTASIWSGSTWSASTYRASHKFYPALHWDYHYLPAQQWRSHSSNNQLTVKSNVFPS